MYTGAKVVCRDMLSLNGGALRAGIVMNVSPSIFVTQTCDTASFCLPLIGIPILLRCLPFSRHTLLLRAVASAVPLIPVGNHVMCGPVRTERLAIHTSFTLFVVDYLIPSPSSGTPIELAGINPSRANTPQFRVATCTSQPEAHEGFPFVFMLTHAVARTTI